MSGQGLTERVGLCIMQWLGVLEIDRCITATNSGICELIGRSPLKE